MSEAFQQGEAKAHLENIKSEVREIKVTMKEHNMDDKEEFGKLNDKVDEVKVATEDAADLARNAVRQQDMDRKINDDRHEETKKTLARIDGTTSKLAKDQASTKATVVKINTIVVTLGAIAGFVSPYVIPPIAKFIVSLF